eukprot:m.459803 g.459803  ORF g.459803 m.459803 type:complete len:499 (-) comp21837_c0_seq1:23-1519(-)
MSSLNFTEFLVAKAAHTASVCDSLGGSEFGDGKVFSGESQIFLIMMGIFIALMQTGFAMLEVGGTGSTATISILFKNIIDCMVGSLAWLACGYAFAFGRSQGQFIGTEGFFLDKVGQCRYSHVFFQLAFATTAGTIVSGAMAGRVHLSAYMCHSIVMSCWVYPAVVHWVWGPDPWLTNEGFRDFAGSAVVHVVGGVSAFIGAFWAGPRGTDTFEVFSRTRELPGHSKPLVGLGTLLLLTGFLAFTGGSEGSIDTAENAATVARAVLNSSIGSASGGLFVVLWDGYRARKRPQKRWNFSLLCNGALTGAVAVCASASTIKPWAALLIGSTAGFIFRIVSTLVRRVGVDDAINATAIHFGGGTWGILMAAFFNNEDSVFVDNQGISAGDRLAWAVCGLLVIIAWVAFWMNLLFFALERQEFLRISDETLEFAVDLIEYGEFGYLWTAVKHEANHPSGAAALASRGLFAAHMAQENYCRPDNVSVVHNIAKQPSRLKETSI